MKVKIHGAARWKLELHSLAVCAVLSAGAYLFLARVIRTVEMGEHALLLSIAIGLLLFTVFKAMLRRGVFLQDHEGMEAMKWGNFEEAARRFENAVWFWERHPVIDRYRWLTVLSPTPMSNLAVCLNNLGLCLGVTGHLEESRKALERLLAIEPDYMVGHGNLRFLLTMSQGHGALIDAYQRLAQAHPESEICQVRLAQELGAAGRIAEARSVLLRVRDIDSQSLNAGWGLQLLDGRERAAPSAEMHPSQ